MNKKLTVVADGGGGVVIITLWGGLKVVKSGGQTVMGQMGASERAGVLIRAGQDRWQVAGPPEVLAWLT